MGNEKTKKKIHTIPKHIKKNVTINLNQSYKEEQKSTKRKGREREYSQFVCWKNMDWMREMILNLYKIKQKLRKRIKI